MKTWKAESKTADNLLKITPYTPQEEAFITSVKREQTFKIAMSLLLSFSFCLSLKRYFYGLVITENNLLYGLSSISVIIPAATMTNVYTNREIINKLMPIKKNHEIMNS